MKTVTGPHGCRAEALGLWMPGRVKRPEGAPALDPFPGGAGRVSIHQEEAA
jgi:hypothetical protein